LLPTPKLCVYFGHVCHFVYKLKKKSCTLT
jgi:hypothetical protein